MAGSWPHCRQFPWLHLEEGGNIAPAATSFRAILSEIVGLKLSRAGQYEYGSDYDTAPRGVWRILRGVKSGLPVTVFGVAMAAERHRGRMAQELGPRLLHGWRWIHSSRHVPKRLSVSICNGHRDIQGACTAMSPQGWLYRAR